MPKIHKIPAFKLLIFIFPFVVIGSYVQVDDKYLLTILLLSLVLAIFCIKIKMKFLSYILLTGAMGITISNFATNDQIEKPDKIIPSLDGLFNGKVLKINKIKHNYIRLTAKGTLDLKGLPKLNKQKIFLNVFIDKTDPEYNDILPGSYIYAEIVSNFSAPKLLPGEFDQKKYLKTNSVNWSCISSAKNLSIKIGPSSLEGLINKIHRNIKIKIENIFPSYSAGIVKAMLLGDKSDIDAETKQAFSYSGTAHLLAISGLHIGIIASMIHFLIIPFFKNRYAKFAVFSIVLILFIFVSGFQDSAVRAGSMAIIWSFSYLTKRRIEPLNVASIVVLAMIIINPDYIHSVSFQMSSSAILGILVFFNMINRAISKLINTENIMMKFIANSVALTLSASLVVSPLVAFYFGVFSIISPIANIVVLPLMSLGLLYSIFSLLFSYILAPLSIIFSKTAMLFIELSDLINKAMIEFSFSYIDNRQIAVFISILFSIMIIYSILSKQRRQLVFRTVFSLFIYFMMIYYLFNDVSEDIVNTSVYPREQFVMIEIANHKSIDFVLLDRKPSLYPKNDFSVVNYLNELEKDIRIFYSGNAGINITDKLKKSKKFIIAEITIANQKQIDKLITKKTPLVRIIE